MWSLTPTQTMKSVYELGNTLSIDQYTIMTTLHVKEYLSLIYSDKIIIVKAIIY